MEPIPSNLEELIRTVKELYTKQSQSDIENAIDDDSMETDERKPSISSTLVYVLKKYRFWPALQVKRFFLNKDLVLLHNTYKRGDVAHFQKLYDQSRSIVLDFTAPEGENIVVTYTQPIPERKNEADYLTIASDCDIIETSYEGTVVTVYNYKGIWYYGTTSCPTIDSSRFFHPTKTHGIMLDEALAKITNNPVPSNKDESIAIRQLFADTVLDTTKAYAFVLVHYQNKHLIDYSDVFGENYMRLVHIVTRSRESYADEDISEMPFQSIGIVYPQKFTVAADAVNYLQTNNAYGLIVKTQDGKYLKVSRDEIIKKEEHNIGHSNPWHNMLHVYIQHTPYKINDYIKEFDVKLTLPKSSRGVDMDPTYIIHTSIVTLRDFLFKLYNLSTTFDEETKRYTIDKENDALYAPIIRFHLVQLRNIQVTRHKHAPITDKTVYIYLCHSQTIKNLRLLIKYFATEWIQGSKLNGIPYRAAESLVELNKLLSDS